MRKWKSVTKITPIILCGGSGSRLWPLSSTELPKQFLTLIGSNSLLQNTVVRTLDNPIYNEPIFVASEQHKEIISKQVAAIGIEEPQIVLEPRRRNTFPAILAATFYAEQLGNEVIHVMPSDHHIVDDIIYRDSIKTALSVAVEGMLVTFGVVPRGPETGYGYVEAGRRLGPSAFCISSFHEKPNFSQALRYIENSNFYWNSGMFVFSTQTIINEAKKNCFDQFECVYRSYIDAEFRENCVALSDDAFARCVDISIDDQIFTKTEIGAVVPTNIRWSDIGSWASLYESVEKDDNNNASFGPLVSFGSEGNLVHAPDCKVALNDVKGLGIIYSNGLLMVTSLDKCQNVKQLAGAFQIESTSSTDD
jgi:mannose-1-phosphate guanylyltransferase/mannose-6-phosphate isomerase